MFNPHNNRTADGVVITVGMAVFTNEMNLVRVVSDDTSSYQCTCENHDKPDGQIYLNGTWFSDHPRANALVTKGCYCRHDHWFTVEAPEGEQGSGRFNGERLGTRHPFSRVKASDAI